jgi:putative ABC transport system substrate-binding protein
MGGEEVRSAPRPHKRVHLHMDVIFAITGPALRAAQQATATIPIVMMFGGDPVRAGFVQSLARPEGTPRG